MKETYLQFLRLAMGVVLGALLLQTSDTLLETHAFLWDYRFVMQLISLTVFVEFWLVITKYHQELNVNYYGEVLFADVVILALPFIFFIKEVREHREHLPAALLLLAGILFALFLRQLVPFRYARPSGSIRERLQIAMAADFVGIGLCLCAAIAAARDSTFLYLNVLQWSWFGFVMMIIYMLAFRFGIRFTRAG